MEDPNPINNKPNNNEKKRKYKTQEPPTGESPKYRKVLCFRFKMKFSSILNSILVILNLVTAIMGN